MELQAQSVVRTAGEQLQVPLTAAEDPAERHLNEAEDDLFHTRGRLQTESLVGGDFPHEPDVEVADQGRNYHEHSVFFHKREGQVFPAEVVVLHVESALRRAALVVELHHLALGEEGHEREARQPALLVVDFRVAPFILLDFRDALLQCLTAHSSDVEGVAVA